MTARPILSGLVQAGVMIAAAAALKYAESVHAVAPDVAARAMQAIIGLSLAFIANFMPKSVPASRGATAAGGRAQSALRIGGWAFMIAGLLYAAIWALAPLTIAGDIAIVPVAAALVVTIAYALWAYATCARGSAIGNSMAGDSQ